MISLLAPAKIILDYLYSLSDQENERLQLEDTMRRVRDNISVYRTSPAGLEKVGEKNG